MSSETNQGFEQELVAYERLRHQKHSAHHLSPQQILVLRRVVNSGCLERHALISPELCDSSLSRTVSYLAKHKLVRPTIDNCDRRKRILYSTRAGERLIRPKVLPRFPSKARASSGKRSVGLLGDLAGSGFYPEILNVQRQAFGRHFRKSLTLWPVALVKES